MSRKARRKKKMKKFCEMVFIIKRFINKIIYTNKKNEEPQEIES